MLKRAINKKSLSKEKSDIEYVGDSTVSSDDNSECCSEPMNETEDFILDADSRLDDGDRKKFSIVDTENVKESRNLDSTSFARPSENLSGSLQNVHEIKTGVIFVYC